jgi:hypothetical protein
MLLSRRQIGLYFDLHHCFRSLRVTRFAQRLKAADYRPQGP